MTKQMKRRQFLQLTAAALVAPQFLVACSHDNHDEKIHYEIHAFDYELNAGEAALELLNNRFTPGLAYNGQFPAPVIRAVQGKRLRIRFTNHLSQPSTIHWHGIRNDNAMDGVPWLTQKPVMPGETFVYDFVCPDAGTFWYHPHIHSIEQMSKGMVGALIVDEPEVPAFDQELILSLKDWRLDENGQFLPLSIPREAFRAGTLGTVNTVNGKVAPEYTLPAGSSVRVRLLNLDNTRAYNIAFKSDRQPIIANVIAIDGSPVAEPWPLDAHAIGAGQRLDVALLLPDEQEVKITVADRKGRFHVPLCHIHTAVADQQSKGLMPVLPANPVKKPDLENAEKMRFVFEWQGALSPTLANGELQHDFWLINRRGWEGMSEGNIPEPLAVMRRGKSYIVELKNNTPHQHPIHMHGEIFTVLDSDKKALRVHQADTVLLDKYETVHIALVADNPGRWMFHCHVVEHMKTGLMGYISVA